LFVSVRALPPPTHERAGECPHDPVGQLDAVHAVGVEPGGIHDLVLAALDREPATALEAVAARGRAAGHGRTFGAAR
jgi:hypothetical protein